MSFKVDGLDDLQKQLKKMEQGAKELSRTTSVSFSELFTSSFMRKHSAFSSIDDLLAAGGFEASSQEDFEAIPDDLLDKHISAHTDFPTWQDMIDEAVSDYALKKLGL